MGSKRLSLTLVLSISLISMCPTSVLASAYSAPPVTQESVARIDYIDYQYKTVNGVLYRRLYNFTTNKPLSDWEIVP